MARYLTLTTRGRVLEPLKHEQPTLAPRLGRTVAHAEYTSARWRQVRGLALAVMPTCCRCRRARSRVADHVMPAALLAAARFYAVSELQALCFACHEWKTKTLDARGGIAGHIEREALRDFRNAREREALSALEAAEAERAASVVRC